MKHKIKRIYNSNIKFIKNHNSFYFFTALLFFIFFYIGYFFPGFMQSYQQSLMSTRANGFLNTFIYIFGNNSLIAFIAIFTGFLFGVVPFLLTIFNAYMIGAIFSKVALKLTLYEMIIRSLPHSLFELPMIIISLGTGLVYYRVMFDIKSKTKLKKKLKEIFRQYLDLFFITILPLLIIAAFVESLLISNISLIVSFFVKPKIKSVVISIFLAFMFYSLIKSMIVYLKNRELKFLLFVIMFFSIAVQLWSFNYGKIFKMFLEKYSIVTQLLPLSIFFIYLYLEHLKYKESQDKKMIKEAFKYYLSPAVIEELIKNPEKLKLGGEKKELTVFFSDIRGFTTLSEKLKPEELVRLLNFYLTEMTKIIMDNRGLVDKYIGDAIMAFWGAPIYDPNHANYACKTALLLVQKLQKVNKKLKKMGLPEIRVGAGLNTGYMVVGNIGSNQRFDYTVMGDAVNLGSRLEGLTKQYGVSVIVSEFTYRYVKNDFVFRKLDFVRVKGKNEPITIYELVGFKNEVSSSRINKIKEFEKALNLYKEGMFDKAKALFIKIGDNPSKAFLNRCDELIASKPKDWQGIYTMKTK